ncbi:hydrogenase maturation protease [Laceyella putida]
MGNRLMMDDGIGVYIVEELQKQNKDESVKYIVGETDIDFCLDVIENTSYLIVIDAVKTGKEPGEISIYSLDEMPLMNLGFSSHNLHFFHFLYHKKQRIKGILIGIEPFQIDFNLGLSSILNNRFHQVMINVKRQIQKVKETAFS